MIQIKDGVKFVYSPGGLAILNGLKTTSKMMSRDLMITSGADGIHFNGDPISLSKNEANPNDPHYKGDAYDVRSHDMDEVTKQQFLANLNNVLNREYFYFFLENPGKLTEHFHIQVKKGTFFGIEEFLSV